MDPDIDDLELIKIVEQQPCLYAKTCKEYKSIDKGAVWTQIGLMLTHQKTGHQAMKRWESLRTQWSCEHKRKREYKPSGSGAITDTQEFRFYGEMSFLIIHYVPRPTRGNMNKVPVGPSSSETSSSTDSEVYSDSATMYDFNYSSQLWNTNLVDDSSSTDESVLSPVAKNSQFPSSVGLQVSPPIKVAMQPGPAWSNVLPANNKSNLVDDSSSTDESLFSPPVTKNLQFPSSVGLQVSPAIKAAMQPRPARGNVLPANNKFKSTSAEVVVPPSDNFRKKGKTEIDLKMDKSLELMETVAKRVDNEFEKKEQERSADPKVDAAINFIRALLKRRVNPENQYKCMRKIMEVIDQFSD